MLPVAGNTKVVIWKLQRMGWPSKRPGWRAKLKITGDGIVVVLPSREWNMWSGISWIINFDVVVIKSLPFEGSRKRM